MKKTFLLLVFVVIFAGKNSAQEQQHEVYAGYGLLSSNELVDAFSSILATTLTGGSYKTNNSQSIGNILIGYKYLPNRRIAVGASYAYNSRSADVMSGDVKNGDLKRKYQTLAGEFEFRYIAKGHFKLYSSLGAGVTLYDETYTSNTREVEENDNIFFNFQVSALGFKFGDRIGGFAEVGLGYKGILSAGLFASF